MTHSGHLHNKHFRVCLEHVIIVYYNIIHINLISRSCLEKYCIGIKGVC